MTQSAAASVSADLLPGDVSTAQLGPCTQCAGKSWVQPSFYHPGHDQPLAEVGAGLQQGNRHWHEKDAKFLGQSGTTQCWKLPMGWIAGA
jgi:hypothetical protein